MAKEGLRTTVRKSRSFPPALPPISGQARKRRYARNLENEEADPRRKHLKTRGWMEGIQWAQHREGKWVRTDPAESERQAPPAEDHPVACLQE